LTGAQDRLRFGCVALLLLIACAFGLDFLHGVRLGENHVGFHPIYRLRQSLAVAISRLHDPPLGGYLAYGSVVNVLDENGFALYGGEPGAHLDADGWAKLLMDGQRLDGIIQQAKDVPIDSGLPPQLIRGNEIGLADYIYLSFQLFGANVAALYYFFYLILGASCLLYVVQFRSSPFLLFLLVLFLGEIFYLETYAHNYGVHYATPANSRLLSGLSLLPALHVMLVLWGRLPLRGGTAVCVIGQSLIFAFLLSCRTEAVWQAAMIVAVAAAIGLVSLLRPQAGQRRARTAGLATLWPGAVFMLVVSVYFAAIFMRTDRQYTTESGGHVVWHTVVAGILQVNPDLRREYVGDDSWTNGDRETYIAVIRDLEARHDFSSPVVRKLDNGEVTIDLLAGYGEYDRLARSLALRIILHHPLAVLAGTSGKLRTQIARYDNPAYHTMTWGIFRVPVILIAIGACICAVAGGFATGWAALGSAAAFAGIVLLFATMTPLVQPSGFSIGSLFSYLGAIAIAASFIVVQAARWLVGLMRSRRTALAALEGR
jgi:hypothetical protein